MAGKLLVEVNFPEDMSIIESKMAEVLADIVVKKYGPDKCKRIADEMQKRIQKDM
ncbi:MAG: hypothetical protein ACRC1T_17470 [Clostridium chrysemydis]|uniref:hypothetical protein n=1 Tax=Bacteria TaxID=2 RepID=UPI0021529FCC|nr:hypothetical protein [Clostridium sp. LY3-2]MCR6515829.1 hypothetical protein [Clostridium sp. LY3-2]